ncbi:MAG TPA: glycosyltransferase, partial [Gaiellaceae bacterium]
MTIVAHDIGPVGGMERQLSELVSGLLSRGVGVTVISRTCELGPHPHLRWVRVPGPARPFVLAYPWFFLVGSILVRRNRSGVLHTTGAIVANRADVCTVHFCHRGGGRLLLRARRQRWTYRLNAALAAPMSRLGELLLYRSRRVQVLVAVSNGLAAELIATLPGATVTVIPNGVDIGRFHPDDSARAVTRAALGVGPQESIALFVGNEWEGKGLVLAMDAVARAPGWRLV